MPAPWLSVIVPAWRAERLLPDTLGALRQASPPPGGFELIVVDDGSDDATAEVAERQADRVIRLAGPSGGPSRARNAGASAATGSWLLFVDADVRVHPDTLSRFAESVKGHPEAAAIFGTYDERPAAPGFVSQYRNLLHRYFHVVGAGPAETFWAGLGGVNAGEFNKVAGFDAVRHPRMLEDIELGYRLREAGGRLFLDPSIEGTHLKRWTLSRMVITDFRDRGLTWMRLVLEGRRTGRVSLNMVWREQARVVLAGGMLLAAILALITARGPLALASAVMGAALVFSNLHVYRWFAGVKGWPFALAVVPLHLWYYLSNAVAAGVGLVSHACRRLSASPRPEHA